MKRELPFLSPLSIAITFIVLAVLGLLLWLTGSSLFSPGPVTAMASRGESLQGYASHAEFEDRCEWCHQPFRYDQAELCLRCHEAISVQISAGEGTHAALTDAGSCRSCHPEHRGRGYDPVQYALLTYDHARIDLPLTGAHALVECESCHTGGSYALDYHGCVDCHAEPQLHAGLYPQACDSCHTDLSWRPVFLNGQLFNHEDSRFSLARHAQLPGGQPVACMECHSAGDAGADLGKCISCHDALDRAFMDVHMIQVGGACLDCHDGVDRMAGFDHARVFPLAGRHAQLECSACHAGFQFASTPARCVDCHPEPEVHAGYFGQQCQACHTSEGWTPALLTQHTFPLNHGSRQESSCQTCHPESYPAYTCYGCHEHQPGEIAREHAEEGIRGEELERCAACHPTGLEDEDDGDHD